QATGRPRRTGFRGWYLKPNLVRENKSASVAVIKQGETIALNFVLTEIGPVPNEKDLISSLARVPLRGSLEEPAGDLKTLFQQLSEDGWNKSSKSFPNTLFLSV